MIQSVKLKTQICWMIALKWIMKVSRSTCNEQIRAVRGYNNFSIIKLVTASLNEAKLLTQVTVLGKRFQCLAAATVKHKSSLKCLKLGTITLLLSADLEER